MKKKSQREDLNNHDKKISMHFSSTKLSQLNQTLTEQVVFQENFCLSENI